MNITKSNLAKLTRPEKKVDPQDPTKLLKTYSLHWDDKLRGFGVRMTSSGWFSYIVQVRINGKERRKTLGRADMITVEQARKMALAFLSDAASGVDPIAKEKEEQKQNISLSKTFDDYLKTRKNLKDRTIEDMNSSLEEMFSDWMQQPISVITTDMVKKRHSDFGRDHSEARANLGMRYLRAIINFAMAEYKGSKSKSVIESNSVSILSKQKAWFYIKRRKTYIKSSQLKPWFEAVQGLGNIHARDFFLICILTGLRHSELLKLRWDYIDMDEKTFTLPDTKNGEEHSLPLSDYLYDLLKSRYEAKEGECVFESKRGKVMCVRNAVYKVREASGVFFNPHDLRRTFITVGDSLDLSYYAIKKLLNHKISGDVTAGYIVTDVERLRKPMQQITDYFLSAWGVTESTVVSFPRDHDGVVNE